MTSKAGKAKQQPSNRRTGRRSLSGATERLTRRVFGRQGFAVREIVVRWPAIVGQELAAQCCPERLVFAMGKSSGATLHVRVDGALALELQHLEPLVIEKINTYYGYGAVSRLSLHQGPVPKPVSRPQAVPPRPLTKDEEDRLSDTLEGIADGDLRQALGRLGRSLLSGGESPPDG